MKNRKIQIAIASLFLIGSIACGGNTATETHGEEESADMHESHGDINHEAEGPEQLSIPEGAKVMFANLSDGDTISMPYTVKFAVEGMTVEPAGKLNQGMGHHHLIINGGFIERGAAVPADSLNIHYGQGQTETELSLDPGNYQLTMQFADGYHQSYGEQMSSTVSVVVE